MEVSLNSRIRQYVQRFDAQTLRERSLVAVTLLGLMSLKRREVRPAIPREEGENNEEPDIYRHVLEIELVGKYADMRGYMQTLEQLDWKLIWDEIEVIGEEYPIITLKLVLSTLSTRKEWIEI